MKSYVKPSIEVISMKTSENIADNLFKTIYTRAVGADSSNISYTALEGVATYNPDADINGSDVE